MYFQTELVTKIKKNKLMYGFKQKIIAGKSYFNSFELTLTGAFPSRLEIGIEAR